MCCFGGKILQMAVSGSVTLLRKTPSLQKTKTMSHARHDHDHDHASGHTHAHAPADFGRAFFIGIALNTGFIVLEVIFGLLGNSTALLADAGHNVSDVLGLVVAWVAATLSNRPPSERYTYGLRNSSILAALFNAMFLLVAIGAIAWEAVQRFVAPQPVASTTVMIVAAVGILVNGLTALLFASGRKGDLNIRGAYLHMLADAGVSAAVVAAGGVIALTGWLWLDPAASLFICIVIFWGTWSLLRDSLAMSLAAVPVAIIPARVRQFLEQQPGVSEVHDLHIWPISTTSTALTCHLVMPQGHPGDTFLNTICHELEHDFNIEHATIQIEVQGHACKLAPNTVV
jgi:cobalt-zinc-cadmium efflux system protein